MATDYDAPRKEQADEAERTEAELAALKAATSKTSSTSVEDEANLNETLELPGADLSDQALTVVVIPVQANEFTCSRCHLVVHRGRESSTPGVCTDCD